jgi:pimeloyl-ACP methyl ester carboxylesterase
MRMRRTSPHSLIGGALILELGDDTTAELASTGVPVLVAHGEWDAAWPIPWQRDMAARLGARYEVVDGAWHSPQIEQPTATVALLADFWGSVPGATRAS